MRFTHKNFICLASSLALLFSFSQLQASEINISTVNEIKQAGRLHIVFSKEADGEPREYSAWPTKNIEPLFSLDFSLLKRSNSILFDDIDGFPLNAISDLPTGTWYMQAIYDTNVIDSGINSPLNFYSSVQKIDIAADVTPVLSFLLDQQLPADSLPKDKDLLKYVKVKSEILSEFWGTDMYLRAGILLPASYLDKPLEKFPVFFDIGGYGSRYTRAEQWYNSDTFKAYWMDKSTPQMVIVFLDGEAPFGDPYQINSANNGPYGDATWQELLPYLTNNYNIEPSSQGRFVSGCSTGGWVSLALQLFYPDTFNGAWSYSADGVDFKYFQLVDIYADDNAFVNEYGQSRPSYRAKDGEVIFSIEREIAMENQMARTNSFVASGGQWGGWNAVFSPKAESGLPAAIWHPYSGKINKDVAEAWKKFDLRLYTENNWRELGPKVSGKLHIWMGDMDNFYLNNAMYLYEDMLKARTEPESDAIFNWRRGVGHCDFDREEMRKSTLSQMYQRYLATKNDAK